MHFCNSWGIRSAAETDSSRLKQPLEAWVSSRDAAPQRPVSGVRIL
jgi:hypothetical protein